MASFFNIASRFGRQPNNKPQPSALQPVQPVPPGDLPPSPAAGTGPKSPSAETPTTASAPPQASMGDPAALNPQTRRAPFFFREENANLIVKGNFMTLAAKPEHVEKGEWLAHQVVEQHRLLDQMLKVIQEVDAKTKMPVCNSTTCPNMTAVDTIYTWLDNAGNPKQISAPHYIQLVTKWINGKLSDPRMFPLDETTPYSGPTELSTQPGMERDWLGKASGFPENFESTIKNLYRQMFRCYAHIYHSHWLDPFYHIGAYKELNTCFIHFVNVGKLWDLLADKDIKPMQPLIDIWVNKGLLPSAPAPAHPQSTITEQPLAAPATATAR